MPSDDEWKFVREDVALDHPEYKLTFEVFGKGEDQMVFVHLSVFKDWSPKLLRRLLHEWGVIRKHVTCPLYARGAVDDDKFDAFVKLFGWKFLMNAVRNDGQVRRIYLHQGTDNGRQHQNYLVGN